MRGEDRFVEIVRGTPWLMEALVAVREVDPPEWLVGGGVLRNAVWDRLHGFDQPSQLADIDAIFFDLDDLSTEREREFERRLNEISPLFPWEARNQAAVHVWFPEVFGYEVEPLGSTSEAVGTWPETATSVGVRLEKDDELTVVAPLGLDDLVGLVNRRNPARVSVAEYERRLATKRIVERWPRVEVVPA